MRLDDLAAEMQANTRTASAVQVTPTMLFDPKELLEYPLAELCRDAGAGIRHSNVQESRAFHYRVLLCYELPSYMSYFEMVMAGPA